MTKAQAQSVKTVMSNTSYNIQDEAAKVDGLEGMTVIVGNDETWSGNEFYVIAVAEDGKVYRIYVELRLDNDDQPSVEDTDYTHEYRREDVTELYN